MNKVCSGTSFISSALNSVPFIPELWSKQRCELTLSFLRWCSSTGSRDDDVTLVLECVIITKTATMQASNLPTRCRQIPTCDTKKRSVSKTASHLLSHLHPLLFFAIQVESWISAITPADLALNLAYRRLRSTDKEKG